MSYVSVIDWAATGTMLQGIATIIGAVAVIGAATIGSRTFENWKRQKLAERHIEQAERILTATYKVRRGLSYVRNPAMWGHETDAAEDQLKANGEWEKVFPESERRSLATAQAYNNWLKATRDDQLLLEECQPMARAFFGEELEKAIEKLNHQFWTVKVYVDANHSDKTGADAAFRRTIESIIWEGYPAYVQWERGARKSRLGIWGSEFQQPVEYRASHPPPERAITPPPACEADRPITAGSVASTRASTARRALYRNCARYARLA